MNSAKEKTGEKGFIFQHTVEMKPPHAMIEPKRPYSMTVPSPKAIFCTIPQSAPYRHPTNRER